MLQLFHKTDHRFNLLKNPKINLYTPLYIIELLSHESLIKTRIVHAKTEDVEDHWVHAIFPRAHPS